MRAGFEARYESPEKLHITLAFLGNVDPDAVPGLEAVVTDVARQVKPFALTLDRLSAFPNERRPRVIYIGAREQGPTFRDVANRLRGGYRALGFAFDDDALAHVTIARVKKPVHARTLPLLDVESIVLHVEDLVLFEAVPEGPKTRYVVRYSQAIA